MAGHRSSPLPEPRARACGSGRSSRDLGGPRGYSLVELLVGLALLVVVGAISLPLVARMADTADGAAAARYVASLVAQSRLDALRRQRTVALRFLRTTPPSFVRVVDGDGDGVTAADIGAGVDRVLGPADRLEDHFARARFGIGATVTGIDDTRSLPAGDDPIRLGTADQLSLSPIGSATSGTLYVVSRGGTQFAVRVAGATGRARVLRYDRGGAEWRPY
jgi:prepilin-type N-terminal cleavage/methylation domain-containing protein